MLICLETICFYEVCMIAMLLLACQSEIPDKSSSVSQEAAAEDSAVTLPQEPVRIVAFGDVHGE